VSYIQAVKAGRTKFFRELIFKLMKMTLVIRYFRNNFTKRTFFSSD